MKDNDGIRKSLRRRWYARIMYTAKLFTLKDELGAQQFAAFSEL
jgi:hypothetical protein